MNIKERRGWRGEQKCLDLSFKFFVREQISPPVFCCGGGGGFVFLWLVGLFLVSKA